MKTIVEYTDVKPALDAYPKHIISPSIGNACCAQNMVQIGGVEREEQRAYFYRRCPVCGFTVRHFLSAPPPDSPGGGSWEDETSKLLKLVA